MDANLLARHLADAQATGEIVAYWPWSDLAACLCGRVVALSPTSVTIAKISTLGEQGGESIYEISDLRKLERQDIYARRLALLEQWSDRGTKVKSKIARSPKTILRVLKHAADSADIIRVEFCDEDYTTAARVEGVGGDYVALETFDDVGNVYGRTVVQLHKIVQVKYGGSVELADKWLRDRAAATTAPQSL